MIRIARWAFAILFLLPLGLHGVWWLPRGPAADWYNADWSSAGVLPQAAASPDASVHIFCAPTGRWKGMFAVHSWIVVKEAGARRYSRFDVAGWGRPVKVDGWAPDGRWFGNDPRLVGAVRGAEAARLIPHIRSAIARYPYSHSGDYLIWPGPNSNTFVASVLADVPEAGIVLPANAIGKDYRGPHGFYAGPSPTATGFQVSALGLLGLTVGRIEGIELNVLTLVAGIDGGGAIKLPGWGTVAWSAPWSSAPWSGSAHAGR